MTPTLRVWAPRVSRVDLFLPTSGSTEPMTADDGGWWSTPRPLLPGTDYAFSLDGGPPRPDPRSPWQPVGVHGPSRTFDAAAHPWADAAWAGRDVLGAVTYELHVGTFTPEGTLDAAVGRLDHLADLGVDVVELMPLAAFGGHHGWGYDGVALWAVHESYGGPSALQRFVDAAHARGLAVCLDVVDNHLGPSGNYLAEFGPYFTDRHHTPWGAAVNLDGDGAAEVRAFVIEKALRWFRDFHVDALRLDAVHALVDDSPQHLLAELSDAVATLAKEVGRPLSLVAESDANDPRTVTPTGEAFQGRPGYGMTAQWADDVHHALHTLLTGERHGYYDDFGAPETLAKALTGAFVHDGGWSTFRDKPWGAPVPPGLDGRRFVVCSQNHDQVGNRALGDRPSRVLAPGALAVSAAVVLLGPFTPMLFMGEEWGATTPFLYFSDHEEPELAAAISRGRAREFGGHGWAELYGADVTVPDPQARETFEASRLDWAEARSDDGRRMLGLYRALVRLRRTEPAIASGDRRATTVRVEDGAVVLTRGAVEGGAVERGGRVDVVLALEERPVSVVVEHDGEPPRLVLDSAAVLGTDPAAVESRLGATTVTVRGAGIAVLR
ncbi:maltooligosyl trehalose hydrolase (EC 3.2.1.141) [Promicromonospora umidemergens]|uniref:Malto-oligosyltrehalose trehalohydrolase n=1 Tax=Promicromonospora umidemergens TaxID=629679 RepID=A0ABP8XAZ0_9MICO|nr:malto-oligosyltrehalose trehalohydrolase [Promicromonospora umidemergens]MCP2281493.1 maltooligosyl trehalose hydrolase (EC 3.2.1.141) [Promicromonospora umidemergens]